MSKLESNQPESASKPKPVRLIVDNRHVPDVRKLLALQSRLIQEGLLELDADGVYRFVKEKEASDGR